MPRWPEQDGLTVERLAFDEDGRRADFDGDVWETLVLDGIGGAFEVVVNGEAVLRDTSMFTSHVVDLQGRLRTEGNVIEVRDVEWPDVPRRPRQRWRTKIVEDGGTLRWFRTAIVGRAPGFAPGPPISGAFRPAWLLRGTPLSVDVRPRLEGEEGVVAVDAEAVLLDGARFPVVDGEARVGAVEPWWPHTHGSPKLYDLSVEVDGGARLGVGRVGFRSVASPEPDAFGLVVNGVPLFARGAVWTPVAEDEVVPTLRALRDAGANLVRIPGIGVPETPEFWDACDALGLMVWQDFLYANMDYPFEDEGFQRAAEDEARALVSSIAGRPSLAVLCGNSEVEQQAAMFGVDPALGRGAFFGSILPALAREAGADVPYVPSAPSGGALPFHPGAGVANYFGVGGYQRPLSDARTAGVRFASECLAFANVPDGATPDEGFVPRDVGAGWDFADVREHYARELYGDASSPALARQVSGEVMARVFGEWRRAASPCAGGIVLWARDLNAGSGWGLLDMHGRPKVALAHLRRAWAPRAVWLVDEGLGGVDVHVANDRPEPLRGVLEVALLADGSHAIAEGREEVVVPGRGSLVRNVEGLLGRFADAAYAYRFGPPAHDAVVATLRDDDGEIVMQAAHFPVWPPVQRVAFTLDARLDGDGDAVVLLADRLAWGVRIEGDGVIASDDAFVLFPGVERRVRVAGDAAGARVTTLNLIGETSVSAPDVEA
jgi:beta-mannosidase